jgi:2-octaprenyl-6-methoxyphenol hydroxylase
MRHKGVSTNLAVIGAGPAGLVAALALVRVGLTVTIVAPRPTAAMLAADTRTFAALGGSVDLFRSLGVWEQLEPHTAPLRGIRLIDDRGGLLRAPEVLFQAGEVGLDYFGVNIPQAAMGAVLGAAVGCEPNITWIDAAAVAVEHCSDQVLVRCVDGREVLFTLVVAAEGRNSLGRAAAGIATKAWNYPQSAVACSFTHTRPHHAISTEFHRTVGPLTTVPMPDGPGGHRSSLVWVETPERAAELKAMDEAGFVGALTSRLHGLLGTVSALGARALFPLSGLEAETMARHRIALVGEAGHVLPPIGAQGLNLGLRDAATLAECVEDGTRRGADVGSAEVLATYAERRRADVSARTFAVDLLNRSLLSTALPFDAVRGISLHAMALSPALRRLAMRQGLEPVGPRPRLMRARLMRARLMRASGCAAGA